jgi:hypothetical protein
MSNKPKINKATGFTLYFLSSAALAFASYAMRQGGPLTLFHNLMSNSIELFIGVVAVALLVVWLRSKRIVDGALEVLSKIWHLILAWAGAGLASFAVIELLHKVGGTGAFLAAAYGPFAFVLAPSKLLVVVALLGWSVGFAELLTKHKIVDEVEGKGSFVTVGRNIRKAFGSDAENAPAKKPEDGHFIEVKKEVSRYVISLDDLPLRVPFCQANLAPDWGKKKQLVSLGLPDEGSGLIIGAPGSGKGVALQTMLLNIEMANPDKRILPTKVVVLSIKPRDLAGPTVKHLRSQGMDVGMWDLTGKTVHSDRYGTSIRWSPIMSSGSFDDAKRTAKRLVESGREPESRGRDEFWLTQAMLILGPSLFAAYIRNESYETALGWAQAWTDPDETDVDRILFAAGEKEALRAWQDTRKMLLSKEGDVEWKEQHGLSASGATGMSIQATLNGLMLGLATEGAFRATKDPNFMPRDWVRKEGSDALFLVGNMKEKGMTRSLLATALHELLTEANDFANEHNDERLPYRLIVLGDELANLCPIPDLQEFYTTARSTRIQIIGVFQSYGQIEDVYGRETARILFDASVCTMFLSGITDHQLIGILSTIGGSQRIELNEGSVSARPLIEGQYITAMRAPDVFTGAPGDALLLMSGGIAEATIPFWVLDKRYDERGEVQAQHKENTDLMRRNANKYKAMWGDFKNKVNERRGIVLETDVTDEDAEAEETPEDTTAPAGPATPAARPLVPRPGENGGVVAPATVVTQVPADPSPVACPLVSRPTTVAVDEEEPLFADIINFDGSRETMISPTDGARTNVLLGIYGRKAWLARLTGTTRSGKFDHKFVDKVKTEPDTEGENGSITWAGPLDDGIYQWNEFCVGSKETDWRRDGFAIIRGRLIGKITEEKAYELLAPQPEAARPTVTQTQTPDDEWGAEEFF